MLRVSLDKDQGVAILEPHGELAASDFKSASRIIDPYLKEHGRLKGIIIHVASFPGWDSFASLVAHLRFVKGHHENVSRVAFATDSPLGSVVEKVAAHFVGAEIKKFAFAEFDAAKRWILGNDAR